MTTYKQEFYLSSDVASCLENLMEVSKHPKERIIENSMFLYTELISDFLKQDSNGFICLSLGEGEETVPLFSPIIAGVESLVRDHDYTEKEKCSLDLSEEKLLALGNYLNVCNLDLDTFVNHAITILYMWATFKKSCNYDFWYVEVTFDEGESPDDLRMKFYKLDTVERLAN